MADAQAVAARDATALDGRMLSLIFPEEVTPPSFVTVEYGCDLPGVISGHRDHVVCDEDRLDDPRFAGYTWHSLGTRGWLGIGPFRPAMIPS